MGREEEYPLTIAQAINMASLLASVNFLRAVYGKPLKVNSGYRPGKYNKAAGGAAKSPHLMCQAIDLDDDKDRTFASWCLSHLDLLTELGLYMEDPAYTDGWVHLQILRPVSGNRVFVPYNKVMAGTTPKGGLS
jgi:hypothetical protein